MGQPDARQYPVTVSTTDAVTWRSLPDGDLEELVALAARCVAADGGLPFADSPPFLSRRWSGPEVVTSATRDPGGRLIAAGAVRSGSVFTGLVDPGARGRGLGGRLLDWGVESAGQPVTVETESLTPAAGELFRSRGLRQTFAEDVLRIDLPAATPAAPWPVGTVLSDWSDANAERFFAVYDASFRERPGFPGWSAAEWIEGVAGEDDFHPEWSILATRPGVGDAGFITAMEGWIDQVGVVPGARGEGLAAALVGETLARMTAAGGTEAWLTVNVDNPAGRLYRRLGFVARGRRARFHLEP